MTTNTYLSRIELVDGLRAICAENKTGVMYVTSSSNRSAQIIVDEGKIVYFYYLNKRGRDALSLMAEIEGARYRFQEGNAPKMRTELPETEEILVFLAGPSVNVNSKSGLSSPAGETEFLEEVGADKSLTQDQKRILEEGLAVFIGPMATIICEDHFGKNIEAMKAVELLASEIPTETQAESFREEMRRRILS